jgi:hypothetical protein
MRHAEGFVCVSRSGWWRFAGGGQRGSWVHAHRMLVALDKAHLLAVEILQIRVSLPLPKVLGQAHHPSHDFSAPSEIHVVARVHCHPVQEGRPFVIGPQPVVNFTLLTIVSPHTSQGPTPAAPATAAPRYSEPVRPCTRTHQHKGTDTRTHARLCQKSCSGCAPARAAAAAAAILHTCSLI